MGQADRKGLRAAAAMLGFAASKRAMGDEKDKSTEAPLKKSSLYQQYLAEREEVFRHKWLESERAGSDIGFERALMDWVLNHRAKWRKSQQAAGS